MWSVVHESGLAEFPASPDILPMTPKALLDEILRLPAAERLRLLEEVWDSVAVTPDAVPVPEWHKAELDARLSHPSPEPSLTWEQVQERLQSNQ